MLKAPFYTTLKGKNMPEINNVLAEFKQLYQNIVKFVECQSHLSKLDHVQREAERIIKLLHCVLCYTGATNRITSK